ncbi:MAG TPA: D-alanyl-D-alanine carboxypeptidase/D-alanyl-D-alanine-endopeptidase, partial [Ignavibacteriaceae bacterium]|nr:D-alanyl-D-alanine carboxypeptidase/D-alanyl-D-alanine-endopeptidase [Ignavibacteriaceae bacterium]
QTSLYYTGKILNGTLYGDLYVAGGLDPDFTTGDLDSLISIISLLKINEITGKIIGDVSVKDSLFWGKGWMWDDDPSADAPYLSALNINKNCIKVLIKGKKTDDHAEIILQPPTGYVTTINTCTVIPAYEKDSVTIDRDWINRKNTLLIKGTVKKTLEPDTVSAEKILNLFEPEKYFLTLLRERLDAKKISGKKDIALNKIPRYAVRIFTFERTIDSVIVNMNKISDNLSAEMLLYALGGKDTVKPASEEAGLKLVDSLIALSGFNPGNYKLADGSGVSRYNLVSAELLLGILKFIYGHPEIFNLIYKSFPAAGVDGTLKTRMISTAAENNVHAKTGELNGVNALSGYLNSAGGDLIAFSILIQNYTGPSAQAQFFIDEICRILTKEY